jgi:hypothetical protein
MRNFLFCILVFSLSQQTWAFENPFFSQKDPMGWINQPVTKDINYIFLASVASKKNLPVLVSLSYDKKVTNPDTFLQSTLQKGFANAKKFKMKKSSGLKLNFSHAFYEFSYVEEGSLFKGLALLIPQKNRYHFFQFTSGTANYDVFVKDVLETFNSTKLKD